MRVVNIKEVGMVVIVGVCGLMGEKEIKGQFTRGA